MAWAARWAIVLAMMVGLQSGATAADADPRKDLQVIARTLSLLVPRPPAAMTLAVVHAPGNSRSSRQAADIAALLAGGMKVGGMTVMARLVSIDRLDDMEGATAALVTDGLAEHRDRIFRAASGRGLATISFDFDCVRASACVLAVRTTPKVEILLSRQAMEQSGVRFESAFRLLVTEL